MRLEMRRHDIIGLIFLLLFLGFSTAALAQKANGAKLEVTMVNEPWTVGFDIKDFSVKENRLQPDGRVYLLAENEKTMVTLSVYLERVQGSASASGCQETQKARLDEKVEYRREKIETRQSADMEIVEYTIPEFGGVPVQQRNLFACLPKDDVYVDIHLSKVLFKPAEERLFTEILNSVHFLPKSAADTK
jgi:CRISPR/Cas system-associated protein endoribonuclease Cas2